MKKIVELVKSIFKPKKKTSLMNNSNATTSTPAKQMSNYPCYKFDVETLKDNKQIARVKRSVDGGRTWQPAASNITISSGLHANNYVSCLNQYAEWKATGKPDWAKEPSMYISFGTRSDGDPKHAEFTIYYSDDNLSMPYFHFKSYRQANAFLDCLKKDLAAEGWKGDLNEKRTPDEIKLECYEKGLKSLDSTILGMKTFKEKYSYTKEDKADTQKQIDGLRKIRFNFVKELNRLEKSCGKKSQDHKFKIPDPKDKSNSYVEMFAHMFSGHGCCCCGDKDEMIKVKGNVATFTDSRDGDVYQVTVKRIALKHK